MRQPKSKAISQPCQQKQNESTVALKNQIVQYLKETPFTYDPLRYSVINLEWVFDKLPSSKTGNLHHFLGLKDIKTGYEIVICFVGLLVKMKRIHGKLMTILGPAGFKHHKMVSYEQNLQPFFEFIPFFIRTKAEKETFASLFKIFYKDPQHPFEYQIPERKPRGKPLSKKILSSSSSSSNESASNSPNSPSYSMDFETTPRHEEYSSDSENFEYISESPFEEEEQEEEEVVVVGGVLPTDQFFVDDFFVSNPPTQEPFKKRKRNEMEDLIQQTPKIHKVEQFTLSEFNLGFHLPNNQSIDLEHFLFPNGFSPLKNDVYLIEGSN